jgi:23S rRNA-/tRNA-specific pseudouridylate synthase
VLFADNRDRWAANVAAYAEGGGGGRGRGGGGGRGRGRGGRGKGGSKKKGSPPLDLTTADVAAAALSVDPALIPAATAAQQSDEGDDEGDEEQGADGDASSSSPSSSSPRLPDALHAALPDRFPTLSAARRAIRRGSILVAASGADDGAFESVAPPEPLVAKARARCGSADEASTFIVGNCGTLVLGAGVWIVALEPGAEAASRTTRREAALGVAFEDDLCAFVVKPWGVLMSGGDPSRTVSAALARMAAAGEDGGAQKNDTPPKLTPSPHADALPRPQAAHRLDAAVGGLVAVGKTASALAEMSKAFRERRVRKRYRALLRGRLDPNEAVRRGVAEVVVSGGGGGEGATPPPPDEDAALDEAFPSPLVGAGSEEQTSNVTVLSIRLPLEGKPCETRLAVAGFSRCPRYGGWLTTVDLEPVTGRQHQLRRHCAALGHAIVGDGRYRGERGGTAAAAADEGENEEAESDDKRHIGGQGLFLESVALAFERHPGLSEENDDDPRAKQPLLVEQGEPRRFVTLRSQQRSAWAKAQRVKARALMGAEAGEEATTT